MLEDSVAVGTSDSIGWSSGKTEDSTANFAAVLLALPFLRMWLIFGNPVQIARRQLLDGSCVPPWSLLPVIEEPFQRIAMDIVGPLPKSRAGHKYILVICDYATRYPVAVPLHSIDAEHVAEELMQVFARVGIPQEILTDQGTNFTSQLLKEVYRLPHIQPIRTSPYHPQTDGLVEPLRAMLRRATTNEGKDWDRLISYLLFAYWEVPQTSTDFHHLSYCMDGP